MIDLEKLAQEQARVTGDQVSNWIDSLYNPSSQQVFLTMTDGEILRLVKASPSSQVLSATVGFLNRVRTQENLEHPIDILDQAMSGGAHGLADWMSALHFVFEHLETKHIEAQVKEIVSFISTCAQQASQNQLIPLVQQTLERKGFK